MEHRVEMYTKALCPYCHRAKDLLKIKGIRFKEYDIGDDQAHAVELYRRCQRQSVPNIFIDGHLVGDCSDLFDLDERGHLDRLLDLPLTPAG